MKLLIITQKVDSCDPILGFFHRWIEEFAKHCEQVLVICLYKGLYDLPANVKVLSLGKEDNVSRLKYVFRFYKYILREKKNYDSVFVHMNPVYMVLGGLLWRFLKKGSAIWYTHKMVDMKLKIAEKLSGVIFTASARSFRLQSAKVRVMGHGIDTGRFVCLNTVSHKDFFSIITAGRISPVKDYETLLGAVVLLAERGKKINLSIVGGPVSSGDKKYLYSLKEIVVREGLGDVVNFVGPVSNQEMVFYLCSANISVNMSRTGSLDKAILEAMSCGLPVLTSNEAFLDIISKKYADLCFFKEGDSIQLAEKIDYFMSLDIVQITKLGKDLRSVVEAAHGLDRLIPKIIKIYEDLQKN